MDEKTENYGYKITNSISACYNIWLGANIVVQRKLWERLVHALASLSSFLKPVFFFFWKIVFKLRITFWCFDWTRILDFIFLMLIFFLFARVLFLYVMLFKSTMCIFVLFSSFFPLFVFLVLKFSLFPDLDFLLDLLSSELTLYITPSTHFLEENCLSFLSSSFKENFSSFIALKNVGFYFSSCKYFFSFLRYAFKIFNSKFYFFFIWFFFLPFPISSLAKCFHE